MNRAFLILLLTVFSTSVYSQEFSPSSSANAIIHHEHYSLSYSEAHEQAEWVYYDLTNYEAANPKYERTNNFRSDPAVTTGSASLADYKGSGYDRGHLAPAADMAFSRSAQSESFYMSNMSPQDPSFNRGIWKQLEGLVRSWAVEKLTLYVVTGPLLETGLSKMGRNGLSIPRYYYKVLLDYDEEKGEYTAIGFILPNQKGQYDLSYYVVSVDEVEQRTGIDFYPQLSDSIETDVEANYLLKHWNWEASPVSYNGSKRESHASQCQGDTKKGLQCKNKTKNTSGYCYLHESQVSGISTPSRTAKRSESVRCSANTKSETRCKRKTLSISGMCWQHD